MVLLCLASIFGQTFHECYTSNRFNRTHHPCMIHQQLSVYWMGLIVQTALGWSCVFLLGLFLEQERHPQSNPLFEYLFEDWWCCLYHEVSNFPYKPLPYKYEYRCWWLSLQSLHCYDRYPTSKSCSQQVLTFGALISNLAKSIL